MNNNKGRKFTFRKSNNQGSVKPNFQHSFTDSKLSAPSTSQGINSRPHTYKDHRKFESPSKKLKFCSSSERIDEVDRINDEAGDWDLDDDDFAKDLTIDDWNMLDMASAQQPERNGCNKTEIDSTIQSKCLPINTSTFQVHPTESLYKADRTEKTLDLFSNWKTIDTTSSDKDQQQESINDVMIKRLENELGEYARKVKAMEENALAKDGEVKMLREGLNKLQEDKSKLLSQVKQMEGGVSQKQSENEKLLQREVERLQTQLQFKDKEILEAKEWKVKHDNIKTEFHSPKKTASKRGKNSPALSGSGPSLVDKNAIFKQNSFNSPQKKLKLLNDWEKVNEGCSCHKKLATAEKEFTSKIECPKKIHKDIDLLEKVLIEMISVQGRPINVNSSCLPDKSEELSTIVYQLACECVCRLRGRKMHNIVSILELINRHIGKLTFSQRDENQELNLLCQETSSFTTVHEKESCESTKSDIVFTVAGLKVLLIIVKHSNVVQDIFLQTINKWCNISQNDSSEECGSKEFNKRKYVHTELELPHILVLKEECPAKADNMGLDTGQFMHAVDSGTVGHLDYLPHHLIGKLFQILTSDQSSKEMKNIVFEILVCLSCSYSSIAKSGLVRKFVECRLLGLLAKSLDFKSMTSLLMIMENLSVENTFETMICYCPDNCPLRALYKVLLKHYDGWEIFEWEQVKLETVQTLLTVLSSCPEAVKVIVSSECSNELVKSLVITLFEEYKQIREDFELQINHQDLLDSKKFLLLRQGMSLLAQISWNDKQFMDHRVEVEWQYLDLIYGTIRLFRRIPFIEENEVIAVQDLRDIDQCEEVEELEGTQSEAPMDQE